MKPDYKKNTKWLDEADDVFRATLEKELMRSATTARWWDETGALEAELKRYARAVRTCGDLNLTPSDRRTVAHFVFFDACARCMPEANKRLKSSKGGAKAAKTKKDKADARHAKATKMIAKKLEKLPLNGRKQSDRGMALDIRKQLNPKPGLSTILRLIAAERAKGDAEK
jgi:hypothetical protein